MNIIIEMVCKQEMLFPIPSIHNTRFYIRIISHEPDDYNNQYNYFPVIFDQYFQVDYKLIHIGDFKIEFNNKYLIRI